MLTVTEIQRLQYQLQDMQAALAADHEVAATLARCVLALDEVQTRRTMSRAQRRADHNARLFGLAK